MARLPDDTPNGWHELARQSPGMRARFDPSYALAVEPEHERSGVVGLSDAPLLPGQRFETPAAPAPVLPQGEEVDPVERARLNVVDQFYRGTLQGATNLRRLAALAEASDDPELDGVTRAEQGLFGSALPSRAQMRDEYRKIVADLQKFDRIRPSASLLDYAATVGGQVIGGIPTPESLAGLPVRGATLLGRMAIAGATTAGLNAVTDYGVQQLSIGSKVQEKYDWVRTAASAPIGFVIGAGVTAGAKAGVNAVDGAARWIGSRFERQSHPRVSVRLASPGTGKPIANDPWFGEVTDAIALAAGEAGDIAKGTAPQQFGTNAHIALGERVNALKFSKDVEQRYRVYVEKSYISGRHVDYNEKGSIRPDVVLVDFVEVRDFEGRAVAVFDFKTGSTGLNADRIRKLQNAVKKAPDEPDVPVIQIDYHRLKDVP